MTKVQKNNSTFSSRICGVGIQPFEEDENLEIYWKPKKSSPNVEAKISNRMSSHLEGSVLGSAVKNIQKQYFYLQNSCDHAKNKGTQTDFRESECQTIPWEPPYIIKEGHKNPEVLNLVHLLWEKGLPAGNHEVEIIHRISLRKAWEEILPPRDTPANKKLCEALISTLESDQSAFRDAEIQFIMDLRMELAEKMMQSLDKKRKKEADDRYKRFRERLDKRKQHEMKTIRTKFCREIRRLAHKHGIANERQNKRNIIDLPTDRNIDFSLPKVRYDCHKVLKSLESNDEDNVEVEFEIKEKLSQWLFSVKNPNYTRPKSSSAICSRKISRNEKKLAQLCHHVESNYKTDNESFGKSTLLKLKEKPLPSRRVSIIDTNEQLEQKQESSALQGFAVQNDTLEEPNLYIASIDELQPSHTLDANSKKVEALLTPNRLKEEQQRRIIREEKVNEILRALEGKTISNMLIFLNDELTRLQSEKKAHATALLAERERLMMKVEQASKEQLEVNQRQEVDEIYRQIIKVEQESVEMYLEDVIKEGIEWISEKNAEKYIVDLADKKDALIKYAEENSEKIDSEGMVSDVIYNFVLPQVEKEFEKEKLRYEQNSHLRTAHDTIYDAILNMTAEDLLSDFNSDSNNSDEGSEYNEKYKQSRNVYGHSLEDIIALIIDFAGTFDENEKIDVHNILMQMLQNVN